MKRILLLQIIILLIIGTNIFALDNFDQKLKNIELQKDKRQKIVIDSLTQDELHNYLIDKENVSLNDFKEFRRVYFASDVVLDDLDRKYDATVKNYQEKITDKKDRNIYRIAIKNRIKHFYKAFYACKGDDEEKVKESYKKVENIRSQISAILQKDKSMKNSDITINLEEQILEECKFEDASLFVLDIYRSRKMPEKFNSLMLRMIEDDQVNYDYLYAGLDKLNTIFVRQYLFFLQHVNTQKEPLILNKEQVKTIAESVLTKHQEIFNLNNSYYFIQKTGTRDEYLTRDAVQSLVNVSAWLREYSLNDLNDQLVAKFFTEKNILEAVNVYNQFKDFREYLKQRKGTM